MNFMRCGQIRSKLQATARPGFQGHVVKANYVTMFFEREDVLVWTGTLISHPFHHITSHPLRCPPPPSVVVVVTISTPAVHIPNCKY